MRCLFCKSETTGSEPLEHILPEGIGNKEHVLRRGVVCGKCNNYFASKVEKPFLEMLDVTALRFEQGVPSKRGRVPLLRGLLLGAVAPIELVRNMDDGEISICLPDKAVRYIEDKRVATLILPVSALIGAGPIVSRFLGKIALESMAQRIEHCDDLLKELVDNNSLDLLRDHARRGGGGDWPISIRRIYDGNSRWSDGLRLPYQIMHEFDFLVTNNGEIYFILAIFGQELVINMGGRSLRAWQRWLSDNNGASPLHHGKNGGREMRL